MSKNREDGKTKKISRRRKNSGTESQSGIMGEAQIESGEHGTDQIVTGRKDCGRRDIDRDITPDTGSDIGKILERLRLLEERYIAYVKAHQGRLKARLDESEG